MLLYRSIAFGLLLATSLAVAGCQSHDQQAPKPVGGDVTTTIESTNEQLSPAMTLYRQAQREAESGEHDKVLDTARAAMKQFIEEEDNLAWMLLESIDRPECRIDVHFNMGQRERTHADGIHRVLIFRVWKNDQMIDSFNYEMGCIKGKYVTAAMGKWKGNTHYNMGMLDTSSTYAAIRARAIEIADGD